MGNPITTRNPYFSANAQRPNQFPGAQRTEYGYGDQYAPSNYGQSFDGQYVEGGAFVQDSGRMTYTDALNKVGILLGIALISGVATALLLPPALWMPVSIIAVIGALVSGFLIAFQKVVKPGAAIAYSALEGVALGAFTAALEIMIPGVAIQAVLATSVIVGVTLALHYSGTVRTTPKGRKIILVVMLGYLAFSLLNFVLSVTGLISQPWGMRGFEVAGIPLGVIMGVAMILIAAYMLIGDFEDINAAIVNGAPREFSWTVGIAIVMTILWIYVEVLRLIAILSDNR